MTRTFAVALAGEPEGGLVKADNEAVTPSWSIVPSAGTWGAAAGVTP